MSANLQKLELFGEGSAFVQEGSPEVASTQSLKLFGKMVLITDSHRPSSPTTGTQKSLLSEATEERGVQPVSWNLMPMNFSQNSTTEFSWSVFPCGAPVYYMQFLNENSDPSAAVPCPMPWWSLYGGLSFPSSQPCDTVPAKDDAQLRKEGSLTGSCTGSANMGGESDKNWDTETQSGQFCMEKEENELKTPSLFKPSQGSAFSELRTKGDKSVKGFVPYKRCLAERDIQSTITGEEREEQRVRLCL